MSKVKILVVEDEMIIADTICNTLEDLGYDALEPAINFTEAIAAIETVMPDIAILDIQLSGSKTGVDIAKKINEDYDFPFIFLTSNSDIATIEEVKKVNPPAFLVKPFSKEELYSAIEIVLFNYASKTGQVDVANLIIKDAFFVKDKSVFFKFLFDDILYIRSSHVYCEMFLKNNKIQLLRISLNDIVKKLNQKFIRVHRSYIVNLDYLERIDNTSIIIKENVIPIGKKYKQDILSKINFL